MKQYEKFSTLLRNELCSNNLSDFALKKGLQNLNAVRTKFLAITDRFARLQAQWLNVHVDFPLLQRMALPIVTGSVYYAGDGSRYAYRLTSKGFQVALLFLFFHKRLCGPLANSRFHHQPDTDHRPKSKLEAAYYKADRAIQDIVNLLDAA